MCDYPNSLSVVQSLCHGKERCEVRASKSVFASSLRNPCPTVSHFKIAIDYDCHPWRKPAPLFDSIKNEYHHGVTPTYLQLPGHTAPCPEKKQINISETESSEIYTLN